MTQQNNTFTRSLKGHKLLLFLLCCMYITNSKAQDTLLKHPITIQYTQRQLTHILTEIENQTDCYFTYNTDLIDDTKEISINATEKPLAWVLRQLLPDTTLKFHVVDRQIIISNTTTPPRELISHSKNRRIPLSKQLRGKIIDRRSKKPLPYASIGIKGKPIGTITNRDGRYMLNIASKNKADTLIFSYVGYSNIGIPIAKLNSKDTTIKLQQQSVSLQEIVIRNTNPISLLKTAIKRAPKNYLQTPSYLTSFYREAVKKNRHYMIYLEAVLNIYKQSYSHPNRHDQSKIFKSRKIYDTSHLDTVSLRLRGGVRGCLMLDIVKNPPEFLQESHFAHYRYQMYNITLYNNHPVYIISFAPRDEAPVPKLEGQIYLDTRTLALIRAEFEYPPNVVKGLTHQFILKKEKKTKVKPLEAKYQVSYRKINGKYYLNHTRGTLKFKVRQKRKLFSSTFETTFEMATTELDTVAVNRFRRTNLLRPNTILSKEKMVYDPDFWGNNNFITPEDNIQDAIRRISSSMQQITSEK